MVSEREVHPNVGDHRLVTIPTADTTVVFTMASSNDSSDDSETAKFFDNLATSVIQFNVVADQVIEITAINGTNLTEGISVNANTVYQEDKGDYRSITIRTTVNNTQISMRCR